MTHWRGQLKMRFFFLTFTAFFQLGILRFTPATFRDYDDTSVLFLLFQFTSTLNAIYATSLPDGQRVLCLNLLALEMDIYSLAHQGKYLKKLE